MTSRAMSMLALLGLALGGCQTEPSKADAFASYDAGFHRDRPLYSKILLYLPNRFLDLLDCFHVGEEVGLGTGFEIHLTRYGRLGAVAGLGAGVAWLGRHTCPGEACGFGRASFGPWETESHFGTEPWRFPRWDVGVYVFGTYVAFSPDGFVNFLVGWSTFDLKGDDF